MSIVRFLVLIAAIGLAVKWWNGRGPDLASAEKSVNGFVSAAMPDGVGENTVVILAPVNCPSDAAQRADALAAELTRMGIPNVRSSSYAANINDPTPAQEKSLKLAVEVLNGPIPAVFLNGKAKANPLLSEVVAEYRGE